MGGIQENLTEQLRTWRSFQNANAAPCVQPPGTLASFIVSGILCPSSCLQRWHEGFLLRQVSSPSSGESVLVWTKCVELGVSA